MRTRHERVVPGDPEQALETVLSSAGGDPLARLLLRLRGLRPEPSLERFFSSHGFETLEHAPTSVVVGSAGRPWRLRERPRPFADATAGAVQIGVAIATEALEPGRCVLSTETRVLAVDERARSRFRVYWLVVGPFSSLIRRRWLAAAAHDA